MSIETKSTESNKLKQPSAKYQCGSCKQTYKVGEIFGAACPLCGITMKRIGGI
jgi:Zn finger protein HypA/HybF involved in hydrogenase expression